MKQKIHFPKICVFETNEGFDGLAALKLKSILKADLLMNQYGLLQEKVPHFNRLNPKVQHQARESFLHALSSLPQSLTLELHMIALPDLANRSQGQVLIDFFLRAAASTKERVKEEIISQFLTLVPVLGAHIPENEDDMFQGGFSCIDIAATDVLNSGYFPEREPFTLTEASCGFRLPAPPMEDHFGLPVKRWRTSLALLPFTQVSTNGTIKLVVNEHKGMMQPVNVAAEDRMRHTFILGQTGTGKSTLMESMILQDMRAGRGLAVIDPHGEMVDSILGRIPPERVEDVVLFDVLDREMPLGFNLIEWKTIEERDLIIDEIYLTMDRLYDMKSCGGPIFETNFRGMLKLLILRRRSLWKKDENS